MRKREERELKERRKEMVKRGEIEEAESIQRAEREGKARITNAEQR